MINFYAHRARNNHSFKDNSKEAILSSINKDYISGVEIDIRLTKDKKIVIYHDPIIIINGKLKMINEVNYIDLNKLDKSYFTYFDDKVYINSKGMYKINEILTKNS